MTTISKQRLKAVILLIALALLTPIPGYAKNDKEKGPGGRNPQSQQVRIRAALDPIDPLLVDLATARGQIDFRSKANHKHTKTQLKIRAKFAIPSASVGIVDLASAAAAQIHMEVTRAEEIVADCILVFMPDDDDLLEPPTEANYRLHVKSQGLQNVKGYCEEVPELQEGDRVVIYAIVNETRVDALDN